MKLGLISDSHDRIPLVEKAVEIFNGANLDAVLHCGDFVSPFSMLPFQRLQTPFYAVFGNNDGEKAGLSKLFKENGWVLNDRPWTLELDGKRITMLHEPTRMDEIIMKGGLDLIVFGHTHDKYFQRSGETLVVNPGEACGWVKGAASISIVDLEKSENTFINL
ncbi:MAG: metallophosphoesterase [Nitrospinota bacterium]|nr:metallophosphoesterase [Nitrospinota bacterium]